MSGTGDIIHIVRMALAKNGEPCGFVDAVKFLRRFRERTVAIGNGASIPLHTPSSKPKPDPAKLAKARAYMPVAQAALRSDPILLELLWKTRAVDPQTAMRFGVGYSPDEAGGKYWCFPIVGDDGQLQAVKLHAVDSAVPKSFWFPRHAKKGQPLYPIDVQLDGPIWICSGELKALAVISAGLPAIGVTSGESVIRITDEMVRLIGDRIVVIIPDNDAVGIAWASGVSRLLKGKGIRSTVVRLDLQESGGDIADWLVTRRVKEGVSAEDIRAELLQRFAGAASLKR